MVDKIADGTEQSLFEQHFPRWFVAMTVVVAVITCMAAPLPSLCLDGLAWCWSVRRRGILEMKGWIDQDSASPPLPLSIVTGRLGLLIELCTRLPLKNHSVKQVHKSTSLVKMGTDCLDADVVFISQMGT